MYRGVHKCTYHNDDIVLPITLCGVHLNAYIYTIQAYYYQIMKSIRLYTSPETLHKISDFSQTPRTYLYVNQTRVITTLIPIELLSPYKHGAETRSKLRTLVRTCLQMLKVWNIILEIPYVCMSSL